MGSKSFGTKQTTGTVQAKHGLAADVIDLRKDIEEAFIINEANVGFPFLSRATGSVAVPGGGEITLTGLNLLQGQTFDSAVLALSAVRLTFTAMVPGDSGLKVVVITPASSLNVAYSTVTKTLTIRPAVGGSTAHDIAVAVNADASACRGIIRCTETVGGAVDAAIAETAFTGGAGYWANNLVLVNGIACLPKNTTGDTGAAAWTDTSVTMIVPVLTGAVAGDVVSVQLWSNRVASSNVLNVGTLGLLESAKPTLEWLDGTALTATGADAVLRGANLLQGQTFDTLACGTGTAAVTLTCMKPGDSGFRAVITQGLAGLVVTFADGLLTIELAAANSTANEVCTAVNKAASQCKGVIRAVSGGAGTVLVMTETPLAGGAGLHTGNYVKVSGVEALPTHATGTNPAATWTDTAISVTTTDLTAASPARAATDNVSVVICSNGSLSNRLNSLLV